MKQSCAGTTSSAFAADSVDAKAMLLTLSSPVDRVPWLPASCTIKMDAGQLRGVSHSW